MNDFTKDELRYIDDALFYSMAILPSRLQQHMDIRSKLLEMIESFCDHKWRCWDDEHNSRECIKCGEERQGEINDNQ